IRMLTLETVGSLPNRVCDLSGLRWRVGERELASTEVEGDAHQWHGLVSSADLQLRTLGQRHPVDFLSHLGSPLSVFGLQAVGSTRRKHLPPLPAQPIGVDVESMKCHQYSPAVVLDDRG